VLKTKSLNKRRLKVAFQIPYAAELDTESQMLNSYLGPTYMGLLATAIGVSTGTTLTDCTAVEATFAGYGRWAMSGWTTPAIGGDGSAFTTAVGYFLGTGGGGTGNIYGYFLTDSGGTFFYGVEVFSSGAVSAPQNVQLAISLTYTALSRY
jgi:hypothetical protein